MATTIDTPEQLAFATAALKARQTQTVVDIIDALDKALGLLTVESKPGLHASIQALQDNCGAREWKAGKVRWLRSHRKNASPLAVALRDALRWHQSGGDLHGRHTMTLMLGGRDAAIADQADTLATVLRVIAGQPESRALEAWKRTGIVGSGR